MADCDSKIRLGVLCRAFVPVDMDKIEVYVSRCYCDLLGFSPKLSNIVIPLKNVGDDAKDMAYETKEGVDLDLGLDFLNERVLESSGQIQVLRCDDEASVENYSQFTGVLDLVCKLMIARNRQQLAPNASSGHLSSMHEKHLEPSSNQTTTTVTLEVLASKIEAVLLSQYAKKHGNDLSLRKMQTQVEESHDDDSNDAMLEPTSEGSKQSVTMMTENTLAVEKTTSIPQCSLISLRDVYYSLKHLFRSQAQCNIVVLQVGRFLEMTRFDMGIAPASRGYIAGLIRFRYPQEQDTSEEIYSAANSENMWNSGAHADSGLSIHAKWASRQEANKPVIELLSAKDYTPYGTSTSTDATSTDSNITIDYNNSSNTIEEHVEHGTPSSPSSVEYPRYLLIIEKEGIFKHLVSIRFFDVVPCILVTGCGFPDISTRACVSSIVQQYPHLIVFGLCDYNVYGMSLLMSYTYSNEKNMSNHEAKQVVLSNAMHSQSWSAMKWIGLRHSQVTELRNKLPMQYFERLSERDKKRIESLQRHELVMNCSQLYEELEHMLQGMYTSYIFTTHIVYTTTCIPTIERISFPLHS